MDVRLLGGLELRVGDAQVPLRRGRPRALLIALVLADGDVVPAETLIDRLWGEDVPANPHNALQTLVAYLRRTLAGYGADDRIQTRGSGYAIDRSAVEVDVRRFADLVQAGRELASGADATALTEALRALELALSLWRGEPFADIAGAAFVAGEAARLEELRVTAEELRAEALLGLGRHDEAVAALRALVVRLPLRERLHELLMIGLYRAGRQAEALQAYQQARDVLVEELGIDPGPELQRAEQRVLSHDPALDWVPLPEPDEQPSTDVDVPAPPAHSPRPRPLPAPVTALLGRDRELARLEELLTRTRILTLTGPGGAGKTRLALELARRADRSSVTLVDLSPVRRDEDVALVVVTALGVPTPPDTDPLEGLAALRPPGPALLLLDTCEHVVEGAADAASTLLQTWPELTILATSRRPLQINGELAWPVPPLPVPDPQSRDLTSIAERPAVQLFVERARSVRPDFRLTQQNAADVGALCAALDGLPLALELAAAHADVLTPAAMRERLDRRFGLLVRGPRDLAVRQRELRTTIDWSVQLLSDDERRFFARLAAFSGPFHLDAVVHTAGVGRVETIDLLTSLVRQSLVRSIGDDRYVLLDSLRAFATELLEQDPEQAFVRTRHARYYAQLVEAGDAHVRTRDQFVWWERLRADLPNFRAALTWAFDGGAPELGARIASHLAWFWTHEGMLLEADRWLTAAADVHTADPGTRSYVLTQRAMYLNPLGRLDEARQLAEEGYRLALETGDGLRAGQSLLELGVSLWALGDLDAAADAHDNARHHLEAGGDPWGVALMDVLRSRTAVDRDEEDADRYVQAGLDAARRLGDRHLVGVALQTAARHALLSGDLPAAEALARESLDNAQQVAYQEGIVAALHVVGEVAMARGRDADARAAFLDGLALAHGMAHLAGTCEALESLAVLLASTGEDVAALRLLRMAGRRREQGNLPRRSRDDERAAALLTELEARLGDRARRIDGELGTSSPTELLDAVEAVLRERADQPVT